MNVPRGTFKLKMENYFAYKPCRGGYHPPETLRFAGRCVEVGNQATSVGEGLRALPQNVNSRTTFRQTHNTHFVSSRPKWRDLSVPLRFGRDDTVGSVLFFYSKQHKTSREKYKKYLNTYIYACIMILSILIYNRRSVCI